MSTSQEGLSIGTMLQGNSTRSGVLVGDIEDQLQVMTSNAVAMSGELESGIVVSEELLSANKEVEGQMQAQERALESSTAAKEINEATASLMGISRLVRRALDKSTKAVNANLNGYRTA